MEKRFVIIFINLIIIKLHCVSKEKKMAISNLAKVASASRKTTYIEKESNSA